MANVRSVICLLAGHVDHGKSKILERIANVKILEREAGGITQAITAIKVEIGELKKLGKGMQMLDKIKLPGILLIDTPGHAAFASLRKRGGNLADIAILVVDINEGIKPQTLECFEILKSYRTPFIIALNKIDLLPGWRAEAGKILLDNLKSQSETVMTILDKKIYDIVGKLFELGFNSERFDRVEDYTKQIAIVPCSAKTGEGISEVVMVVLGLAQKFLEQELEMDTERPGRATVLEVTEEKGMGTVVDVILYSGKIKQGDTIIVGSLGNPIVTKVKGLFEIEKYSMQIKKEVTAAASLKVSALGLQDAISGMPLLVSNPETLEKDKELVEKEVKDVMIDTDNEGLIIKADSLGSLEAMIKLLKERKIPIKRASIGKISKKDLAEAGAETNPLNKVILGFNVNAEESVSNIKVICHDIIYKLIESYEEWHKKEKEKLEASELEKVIRPAKIKIMPGCVFRQNNPAIVGVDVLSGKIKTDTPLMKPDGSKVGVIKSMQLEGTNIREAEKGKQVAISLPGVTVGRQVKEGDVMVSDITEEQFRIMKRLKNYLTNDERELLKEIAEMKRKKEQFWGR